MPCPYAHIFGIPGEGFHGARVSGFALNDILGTLGLAAATSWIFGVKYNTSILSWFVAAEALHYAFGVHTAFLVALGISPTCEKSEE
jgi:hypothetical protein